MTNVPNYQCTYCHKTFIHEGWFLNHTCEMMKREEEIKTPTGQAAWLYYQKWMKANKKKVEDIRTFINSRRYFRTFMKFAEFARRVRMNEIDNFMIIMKEKDIPPALWTNDQVYEIFLEHLDHIASPMELGEKTVDFLHQIAEQAGCTVSDAFDQLEPGEVMELIRVRKFTPWILLRSRRFGKYLQTLHDDDREQFANLMNSEYWRYKFETNPEIVKWMDTKVRELNI